jgi:hypothetical protein
MQIMIAGPTHRGGPDGGKRALEFCIQMELEISRSDSVNSYGKGGEENGAF